MFDREFIQVTRVMDDAPMHLRIKDIQMITVNADEKGPQAGVAAIYLRDNLAVAVNAEVEDIVEQIREKELTQ